MYVVPSEHRVKLATMYFTRSVDFWMQSIEMDLRKCTSENLCYLVLDRFERAQYNQVIRQFFYIKQSSSVAEYIEAFDELVHKMLAHDPYFNPSVGTSRFVDGLRPEIKAVVLVHRPKDLDTASSLAILQEEVLLGYSSSESRRYGHSIGNSMIKVGFSPQPSRPPEKNVSEERKSPRNSKGRSSPDKMAALMAYKKAKGLCYKCGAKWGPQHSCPDYVPMHVVEELWQMIISVNAVNGTSAGKTIKLKCSIGKVEAIVLLDSGSSHSFISEQVAALIPGWKPLHKIIQVRVADGRMLLCAHEIVDCLWLAQGTQFRTNFKILPMKCYDAILGMD